MAVSSLTIRPRMLCRLQVSGVAGELELLRWTFATEDVPASVTSAAGLPAELLAQLKHRLELLAAAVDDGDLQDQQALLALVCRVRDGRGEVVGTAVAGEGFLSLVVGELDDAVTYYLFVGIPHSLENPLC